MPKLWKFLSRNPEESPQIQTYEFGAAEDLELKPDPAGDPEAETIPEPPAEPEPEPLDPEADPIGYAQVQAEQILKEARQEAEAIVLQAGEEAAEQAEKARKQAAEEGFAAGFQEGREKGTAQAAAELYRSREAMEEEFAGRVEAFSKSAERALTRQLNENMLDMRDLAIAVAEKVVCISLRSSADVIAKMIQTAVDKRKRREWVHIYISQQEAEQMTALPPALAGALAELSDHVRIIPMAGEESGTCIVEFPDEIIDASAATQIQNIREMLNAREAGK